MFLAQQSLNGNLKIYQLEIRHPTDMQLALQKNVNRTYRMLMVEYIDASPTSIKFQICIHVRCVKRNYDDEGQFSLQYCDPYFTSDSLLFLPETGLDELEVASLSILGRFDNFVQNGSGWLVDEVLQHTVKVFRADYMVL